MREIFPFSTFFAAKKNSGKFSFLWNLIYQNDLVILQNEKKKYHCIFYVQWFKMLWLENKWTLNYTYILTSRDSPRVDLKYRFLRLLKSYLCVVSSLFWNFEILIIYLRFEHWCRTEKKILHFLIRICSYWNVIYGYSESARKMVQFEKSSNMAII